MRRDYPSRDSLDLGSDYTSLEDLHPFFRNYLPQKEDNKELFVRKYLKKFSKESEFIFNDEEDEDEDEDED